MDVASEDPYVRLAAGVFLQAVSDYLWGVRRLKSSRPMKKDEYEIFLSAVLWLLGLSGTLTVSMACEAMHVDLGSLYSAEHDTVVREMRIRKRGRRRRDDYS